MSKMNGLKLCSYNVRGLRDTTKRTSIFQFLKNGNNHITYLQETHSTIECVRKWKGQWGGQLYFAHGTSGSRGVAILINRKVNHTIDEEIIDPNGRYLILNVTINDKKYILFNYYAPTKDKPHEQVQHLENIMALVNNYSDENVILGGDFNVCLNPEIDKIGGKTEKQSDYALKLLDYMDEMDLVDIWRKRNPDVRQFTRRQNTRSGMVHSRSDRFLVAMHLEYQLSLALIKTSIHSDHSIIEINFEADKSAKRGTAFWKFNCDLLTDTSYIGKVKTCIKETIDRNSELEDKGLLWDYVKCNVRGITISHASFKAKERRKYENEIKYKLDNLEKRLHEDEQTLLDYENAKAEYERIQEQKAHGIMIRSRAQYLEHGERSSKYFLNLEQKNQNVKHIKCLIDDEGSILTDPDAILSEELRFYQTLL